MAAPSQCLKDREAACCWEVSHWPCQNFLRTAGQVDTLPPSLPSSLLEGGQTTALKKRWVFREGSVVAALEGAVGTCPAHGSQQGS